MSEEGFRRLIRRYVDQGIPFRAYWHPNGFGLIRLDAVEVPVLPPYAWHGAGPVPTEPHQLTKRGLRTWEKNLAQLRKQTWGRVVTVEYDGTELKTEGGFEA